MNDSSSEVGKFIQMKGTEVGADQMILIVGMPVNYGGLGYMPGNHCVIGWVSSSSYTLTHELGHNLGCHHDRETVEKGTTPNTDTTGDGKHHYGFSYTPQTGTNTFSRGTVMSYSSPIPYFSHPEIMYDGVALGVPIGQPRAAHNAQVVSNNASAVAAYRYPAGGPVITAQPSAARIVVGATLSLSVTATGAGLAYQWKKDGVVIDGATASTYTKTSAEIADSGAYSVDVSNVLAWQTSRSASVVVSQPSAPPSSGSSGGGGGGGGAASIWFLMTLGLVVGVRRFLR